MNKDKPNELLEIFTKSIPLVDAITTSVYGGSDVIRLTFSLQRELKVAVLSYKNITLEWTKELLKSLNIPASEEEPKFYTGYITAEEAVSIPAPFVDGVNIFEYKEHFYIVFKEINNIRGFVKMTKESLIGISTHIKYILENLK